MKDPHYPDNRWMIFLNQSGAISEAPPIDYSLEINQQSDKGAFGALVESQTAAKAKRRLTLQDLLHWQALITKEWQTHGKAVSQSEIGCIRPEANKKTHFILAHFLDGLGHWLVNPETPKFVATMAEWLYEFEHLKPFSEANGAICRLVINYAATWCHFPLIIFNESEKKLYQSAAEDPIKAHFYLGQKIREAVFDQMGHLMERVSGDHIAADYADRQGHHLRVEWHTLVAAEKQWEGEA